MHLENTKNMKPKKDKNSLDADIFLLVNIRHELAHFQNVNDRLYA